MAQVVLGMGTSHSPQLSTQPDQWSVHSQRDKVNPELWGVDGKVHTYEALVAAAGSTMASEITPAKFRERYETCQQRIAGLGAVLADVAPDVLIMVGDDQKELYHEDNMPALLIYWGDTYLNKPRYLEERFPLGLRLSAWSYGEEEREYPVASDLAKHLIDHLINREFDLAHSYKLKPGEGMPHAYGFIYRRIMMGKVIPTVPVVINTYYPPNQPTPKRCYDLGNAIREAVETWRSSARVGIIASGGLSHFVVNEKLDRTVLQAMEEGDAETLRNLPREQMMSGNSEIRNWLAVAGAAGHLKMKAVDYVPCYRSPAGTGCGMGFAYWS